MKYIEKLKDDSFNYHGQTFRRDFPREFLISFDEARITGFSEIDLLDNEIVVIEGEDAEICNNLRLFALWLFANMEVEEVLDRSISLARRWKTGI